VLVTFLQRAAITLSWRWKKDPVFGTHGGMVQIGINCHDGTARHDWRDMQNIKNQIAPALWPPASPGGRGLRVPTVRKPGSNLNDE
jgi:hypothetical protein